eukprot:CAMPEP_0181300074 /NCGR_PEP_ID=MMETSP1101-20121128/6689_1 /TAXON_ID=46948 /ORGANISM="Rhodomonas abbreviata, Strain Caron Lab Isolate" /LENGTH=77 /DNA_ID=CAMNT_0023405273 /DNA_START=913 /DNA_END=1146 /DNA_ORIENTATION=+
MDLPKPKQEPKSIRCEVIKRRMVVQNRSSVRLHSAQSRQPIVVLRKDQEPSSHNVRNHPVNSSRDEKVCDPDDSKRP